MAYKVKQKKIAKYDSEGKKGYHSSLIARYRFWNEVSPIERKDVKKRIKNYLKQSQIHLSKEFLYEDAPLEITYMHYLDRRHLGFNLFFSSIESRRDVSLEKIVDLDKLDDWILTGRQSHK